MITKLTLILKGRAIVQVVREPDGIYCFENLRVSPRYRRRGYATELLKFAIQRLGEFPDVDVHRSSKVAQRIVRRLGYEQVGSSRRFGGCDLWTYDRGRSGLAPSSLAPIRTVRYTANGTCTEVVYLR